MTDYVGYLQAPVGTWDGKTYRLSIDGDCHTFTTAPTCSRTPRLPRRGRPRADKGEWGVPKTWQQVQAATKFLKGKQINGQDAFGYLDAPKAWGGFGFYFLGSRATAYAKHPDDSAFLFDPDTMKPRVNNPAWVRAIQDVIDALPSQPADQINADPNQTAFVEFLGGTGSMLSWWGDVGSNVKHQRRFDGRRRDRLLDPARRPTTSTTPRPALGRSSQAAELRAQHGLYRLGRLRHGDGRLRREEAQGGMESARRISRGKDISLWMAAYPSGFQPYRNSHFDYSEWEAAGYDEAFIEAYLGSNRDSYNHPNAAIEPRIPGIFQYYSIAEDELAKTFAGQYGRPRTAPTTSPRPGRRSPIRSAARTRSSSTRPRWACKLLPKHRRRSRPAPPVYSNDPTPRWNDRASAMNQSAVSVPGDHAVDTLEIDPISPSPQDRRAGRQSGLPRRCSRSSSCCRSSMSPARCNSASPTGDRRYTPMCSGRSRSGSDWS